jgi:sulfate transport system substrate-binding protein
MAGKSIQYVIPRQTMLIELPAAVLKNSSNKDKANQFIRFMKSPPAQKLFVQYGFRPVNPAVKSPFPSRPGMFKVDDKYIGGWRNADRVWFDPKNGRMVKIEQGVGGPTTG